MCEGGRGLGLTVVCIGDRTTIQVPVWWMIVDIGVQCGQSFPLESVDLTIRLRMVRRCKRIIDIQNAGRPNKDLDENCLPF